MVDGGYIRVKNNLAVNAPKTYLTTLGTVGTNIFNWKNASQFSASWAIQLGETGEEQTEVLILGTAAVSGTAGTTTANSLFEHPADSPIYTIKYNQNFY